LIATTAWSSSPMVGDHLGVNERQEGQYGSSKQVKTLMAADRGQVRTIRLLPFAAAADEAAWDADRSTIVGRASKVSL
jgi:hypothetical protein